MKKIILTFLLAIYGLTLNSQSIFGKWISKNDKTGEVDSVIEVYKENEKAYAKIVEILDPKKQNSICTLCRNELRNKKILGLNILTGLKQNGTEWSGGNILDPRNGKIYDCFIKLINSNKLKVRGYIGISLFGKTTYWERSK